LRFNKKNFSVSTSPKCNVYMLEASQLFPTRFQYICSKYAQYVHFQLIMSSLVALTGIEICHYCRQWAKHLWNQFNHNYYSYLQRATGWELNPVHQVHSLKINVVQFRGRTYQRSTTLFCHGILLKSRLCCHFRVAQELYNIQFHPKDIIFSVHLPIVCGS